MKLTLNLFFIIFLCGFNLLFAQREKLRLKIAGLNDQDTNKALAFIDFANTFYNVSEYDSAVYFAMKGVELARQQNYIDGIAKNLNIAGLAKAYTGNYEEAEKLLQQGLEACSVKGYERSRARLTNSLGVCATLQGSYKKAIACYHDALRIQEKFNDSTQIASLYNNIGVIYTRTRNFFQAREFHRKALNMRVAMKDSAGIALSYNNISNTYFYTDSLVRDSILYYLNLSLDIRKKINSEFGIAQCYVNIGNYYLNLDDNKTALDYYQRGLDLFLKLEATNEIINAKNNLAEVYLYLKDYQNAKRYGEDALAMAIAADVPEYKAASYRKLAEIYKELGSFDKSSDAYKKYIELKETFYNDELKEKLVQARYDFEYEARAEKLKLEQEKEALILREEQNKQKMIIFAASLIVILILAIVIIYFRNRAKTAKELEEKNKIIQHALNDREVLLKEIHHRVKNNLQIISSLLNLQQGMPGTKTPEEILRISESRIQSMAIIHEKLYQSENFKEIDLQEYLDEFVEHLRQSLSLDEKNITIKVNSEKVFLDIDHLVPCSLVVNELIINSVKHGFNNATKGLIKINCLVKDHRVIINYSDNGTGLPEEFDFTKYNSLGMKLVKGLMKQLKGDILVVPDQGAHFEISFIV